VPTYEDSLAERLTRAITDAFHSGDVSSLPPATRELTERLRAEDPARMAITLELLAAGAGAVRDDETGTERSLEPERRLVRAVVREWICGDA
jgi:hypothetical protein